LATGFGASASALAAGTGLTGSFFAGLGAGTAESFLAGAGVVFGLAALALAISLFFGSVGSYDLAGCSFLVLGTGFSLSSSFSGAGFGSSSSGSGFSFFSLGSSFSSSSSGFGYGLVADSFSFLVSVFFSFG
jgi:hypothetical protein